ncbi:beta-eliminating lyase-related protein, partial [Acinetobacter baumannii]
MTDNTQQFASDNYSGICPEAWAAMAEANRGHERAYGDDQWTARASEYFRQLFETDCEVFFAFNGTAANSLALAALCQSYHSVICSETAHVETDECGAPEVFSNGSKLLLAQTEVGKLTPASIRDIALKRQDIHYPKPRVVTLTQATEVGTVYRPDELKAISATCKELGLHLHMDGARFSNACAFLGCSPAELSWKAGVDVLCFGGTKNGMAVGEAILFFNRDLAEEVRAGRFRADLYHRLSVYPLRVPPLRERGRDILLLAGYFLEENRPRLGLRSLRLDHEAQAALLDYRWPGNVRELEHLVGRASLKALGHNPERSRIVTLHRQDLDLPAETPAPPRSVVEPAPAAPT